MIGKRRKFGAVFFTMLLMVGLMAPASADHTDEHTELQGALADAEAALQAANDANAAWQVAKDAHDEYDHVAKDAYEAAEATYAAALGDSPNCNATGPSGSDARNTCIAARDHLASLTDPGPRPPDPGEEPYSESEIAALEQAVSDAQAALDAYEGGEPNGPEVTDSGDPWDESSASDTAGQCATGEGAVKYDTGASYDEYILIDGDVVQMVVNGKTVEFFTAGTADPYVVDGFCVKGSTNNSGLQSGSSYTVDFVNPGGKNPDISNVVIYAGERDPDPDPVCADLVEDPDFPDRVVVDGEDPDEVCFDDDPGNGPPGNGNGTPPVVLPSVFELSVDATEVCPPDTLVIEFHVMFTNVEGVDEATLTLYDGSLDEPLTSGATIALQDGVDKTLEEPWPSVGGDLVEELIVVVEAEDVANSPFRFDLSLSELADTDCLRVLPQLPIEQPQPQPQQPEQPEPEPQETAVRGEVRDRAASATLPRTGESAVALAMMGLLPLLAGVALLRRRRPEDLI